MKPGLGDRARIHAPYAFNRLGLPGRVGAAALIIAIVMLAIANGPLAAINSRLSTELQTTHERLSEIRSQSALPKKGNPLGNLIADLPLSEAAALFARELQEDAAERGLGIDSAEYKTEKLSGDKVTRYQLTLPVRGTYPVLRAWLSSVLARNTSAALDELSVRRDADGSANLVARVQLSFYARQAQ